MKKEWKYFCCLFPKGIIVFTPTASSAPFSGICLSNERDETMIVGFGTSITVAA
jgi:hypothetical protein